MKNWPPGSLEYPKKFPLSSFCRVVMDSSVGCPAILVRTGVGKKARIWLEVSGIVISEVKKRAYGERSSD